MLVQLRQRGDSKLSHSVLKSLNKSCFTTLQAKGATYVWKFLLCHKNTRILKLRFLA